MTNNFFFFENLAVYNMENFCRVRQTTDDNKITVHAHCMLDD